MAAGNVAYDLSGQTGLTTAIFEDASALNTQTITSGTNLTTLQLATAGNVGTAGPVTWAGPAAATTLNLILAGYQGVTGGTPLALTVTGAADTLQNITSNTLANKISTLTLAATNKTININDATALTITSLVSTAATSVVVTGAGNLTIAGSDLANAGVTINASAATGNVSFVVETGATAVTFTGGTGNDTVTFAAGNLAVASGQVLNGGAGTDTLVINDTTPVYATLNAATSFEVLGLSTTAATVDVAQLTSINAFKVNAGNLTETFNNAINTSTFTIDNSASNSGTVTINDATGSSSTGVTIDYAAATVAKTLAALTFTGAGTVALTSTGTGVGGSNIITALGNIDNSTFTLTGAKDLTITNALAATTTGTKIDASAFTGALSVTGSTKADILIGGSGNDTLINETTGTTASAGDSLTGGAGNDTFLLRGDVASGTVATILSTASVINDFTVGASSTVGDILQLSATSTNYSAAGAGGFAAGVAAAVAGSTAVQTVAANASTTAYVAGTDLIKLSTAVTTTGLFQTAFNAAIGTATVSGLVASKEIFFTIYDSTNSRLEVGIVDTTLGTSGQLETGDTVTLVGSVKMTAADYANFGANNLSIIAS